jgi:hypothetical protein
MDQELADRLHDVAGPCRRHRVARLDIFGSAARQSHGAADLDLLVEFEDLPADAYAASYLGSRTWRSEDCLLAPIALVRVVDRRSLNSLAGS